MADIGHDTAERRQAAILLLEPDFHGLLERKGVTEELQARLSTLVVRSISRFNAIADDRGQLRNFAVRSLERDAGAHAVEIAALLDAWEAARTRMEVRHKAEAEAASANLPMAVNKVEIHDLKKRFEAMHYKLDEKSMPASGTLEQIFDQLENGELKVMHLVQFLSRDDAEIDPVGATIDKAGNIKVRKGYGETTEPRGAEEYRQRMKVAAHARTSWLSSNIHTGIHWLAWSHITSRDMWTTFLVSRSWGSKLRMIRAMWFHHHRSPSFCTTSTRCGRRWSGSSMKDVIFTNAWKRPEKMGWSRSASSWRQRQWVPSLPPRREISGMGDPGHPTRMEDMVITGTMTKERANTKEVEKEREERKVGQRVPPFTPRHQMVAKSATSGTANMIDVDMLVADYMCVKYVSGITRCIHARAMDPPPRIQLVVGRRQMSEMNLSRG